MLARDEHRTTPLQASTQHITNDPVHQAGYCLIDTQILTNCVQVLRVSLIVCCFTVLSSVVIVCAPRTPPSPEGVVCLACRYGGSGFCKDLETGQALVGRKIPSSLKRGAVSLTSFPDLLGRTSQRFFKLDVAGSSLLKRP